MINELNKILNPADWAVVKATFDAGLMRGGMASRHIILGQHVNYGDIFIRLDDLCLTPQKLAIIGKLAHQAEQMHDRLLQEENNG